MADIADMLTQSALQTSQKAPDLGSALTQGAQLAQTVEQVKLARQKMETEKQNLEIQKIDKLTQAMATGASMKSASARNAYFKHYVPNVVNALGLQDFIPPETMAIIQADPTQAQKLQLLRSKVVNGEMTYGDAITKLTPEEFASIDDAEVEHLMAAEKFRVQQEELSSRLGSRMELQKQNQALKQEGEFRRAIAQPASTSPIGKAKAVVDTVDQSFVLLDSFGGGAKEGETREEKLKRYATANHADIVELAKSLDYMLSRGNPTVSSQEHLTPKSYEAALMNFVEKVVGKPTPNNMGAFVEKFEKIFARDRNAVAEKFMAQAKELKESYLSAALRNGIKMDEQQMDKLIAAQLKNVRQFAPAGGPAPKGAGESVGEAWKQKVAGLKAGYRQITDPATRDKFLNGIAQRTGKTIEEIKAELEK